jgi:hypothetical protein
MDMARGVGFEPTRPFDHRLSRPAPYQARATPPSTQPRRYLITVAAFLLFVFTKAYAHQNKVKFIE